MQLQALVVYPLFVFLIMLPPLPLLKRLSWDKEEKLTAAVCLSILALYLISFAAFLLKLPNWFFHVVLVLSLLFSVLRIRDIVEVFRDENVKESISLWLLINLWILLLSTLIQCFSGGGWGYDWFEHYHRSRFFFDQLPATAMPDLPSRPPLMNLLSSPFFAIAGNRFPVFQLLYSQLNTLVILPMLLLGRLLCKGQRRLFVPFAVILTCNPMFVQNSMYTWTKLLAAFFLLAALHFYLKSWKDREVLTLPFVWILLSLALLTHYSAGPYVLIFAAHYGLYLLWKRKNRWVEFMGSSSASGLLFMSWLGWSLWTYGASTTFLSNTSVTAASEYSLVENIEKVLENIAYTILPHFVSGIDTSYINQISTAGYIRDYTFLLYQTNFFFAFGSLGIPFIVGLLLRRGYLQRCRCAEGVFIASLIAVGFVVGIGVIGAPDKFGLMHICSQTHVMLGLLFLGVHVCSLSRPYRILFTVGMLMDCVLGVVLHIRIQSMPVTMWNELIASFKGNWALKLIKGVQFVADDFQISATISWGLVALFCIFVFYRFVRIKTDLSNSL